MLNKEDIIKLYGPNPNEWNWHTISVNEKLSEDFIREFKYQVEWSNICQFQTLSESFIREFKDYMSWSLISYCQALSEDFIEEFLDKVYWCHISSRQTLSENFIRRFKDFVDWNCISVKQKLSESFLNEFKDKIYMASYVNHNRHCSPDIRIKYMKEYNIIKKQDPKTHDFEYFEEPPKPINNSLQQLKELIC